MFDLAAGFEPLPVEYQDVIRLAQEQYNLSITPLDILTGGWSGAIIFLTSVLFHDSGQVEHLILKLDHKNEKVRSDEIQRHQDAARLSPANFASQHMAQMIFERVERGGAVAIFYTIAGQSLHQFRPFSAYESQSQLEILFVETYHHLLTKWNANRAVKQAVHPRQVLEQWLGFRIKPGAPAETFLETVCQMPPEIPGLLVGDSLLPNPLAYARNEDWWGSARPQDILTGLQHGDLNSNNLLIRFAQDGRTIEGFFLIDFALFKEQMPLLFDLRYLEMSYLVYRLAQVPYGKVVDLLTGYSEVDYLDPQHTPVETGGISAVLNKARQAFDHWINKYHPSLHDDLWGQYLLAGCAAGLSYCHKANMNNRQRMLGLIFSAANLKRYATLFGVSAPAEGSLLSDPDQAQERQPVRSPSPSAPRSRTRELPTGQTLTFLFADVENSTQLWEQYPQAMESALERHDRLLRSEIENAHGVVVKTTGDGLLAVFTSILEGVNACIQAQLCLSQEEWGKTGPLRVRMALHAGEAQLRDGDYYGPAINRAARLMSAAHGGQVLLSKVAADMAVDLLTGETTLRNLGEHRLKDLGRPEQIFQLLHPELPTDFPPLKTLDLRPNNLPAQPTPLIGRETELGEILNQLNRAEVRLLTLTGTGGIGKTRLALQAAAELSDCFENGVYFVDLVPVRDPEAVPVVIAQTLGFRGTRDRSIQDELKAQLRSRSVLLLLDNFEQVTGAASAVVDLLRDCPQLKILVTSREALRVRDEYLIPVPPLGLPQGQLKPPFVEQLSQYESVRLFIARAQAVKPDFKVTNDNAQAIAEICVRLDGLPLAIELAAARIRLFTPQALLDRLGKRLNLLRGGARDLPERQQTLRDAIHWSYDLLDSNEKRLFEILSVFIGGSTFEAVEAVSSQIQPLDDIDILEGILSLEDKSMIRQKDQASGTSRLLMLETLREYAAERLEEDPEFQAASRRAHASFFAEFTQAQWQDINGERHEEALVELVADIENIQAAWRYWVEEKDLEQLRKFFDCLGLLYDRRGWYPAMVDLISDMLSVLSSTPASKERIEQEIMLQTSLARTLLIVKGYTDEVEQAYTRALKLSDAVGEIPQLYPVLRGLGSLYGYLRNYEKAAQIAEKIISLAESLDDEGMRSEGHMVLGYNLAFQGFIREGMEHLDLALARYDPEHYRARAFRLGNDPGVICLNVSALIMWMQGFPIRAIERANQAIALARQIDHPYSLAYALYHTSLLSLWMREPETAKRHAQEVLEIAEEHDFLVWRAVASCLHGGAIAGLGHLEEGLAQVTHGINLYKGMNSPPTFWPMLLHIQAEVYGLNGEPEAGLQVLNQALEVFPASDQDIVSAEFYRSKGHLLLRLPEEHTDEAEYWFRRALEIGQKLGLTLLELRAALSLNRLWKTQGKSEQGRKLLSEIYPRFSEGFSTADLMEARELIA